MFGRFGLLEPYVTAHKILEATSVRGALWLGDLQSAIDNVGLKQKNIKTIISVISGMDVKYESPITHKIYYLHDNPDSNISRFFEKTFEDIENGLLRGSVLVHCQMGISRSASTVIAYIMKKFSFGYSVAYNHVKKIRPIICPNYGFSRQLKNYERYLKSIDQKQDYQHIKLRLNQSHDVKSELGQSIAISKYENSYESNPRKLPVISQNFYRKRGKSVKIFNQKQDLCILGNKNQYF